MVVMAAAATGSISLHAPGVPVLGLRPLDHPVGGSSNASAVPVPQPSSQ